MGWMRWMRGLAFRIRAALGRPAMRRELREEMEFHLEMEVRKHRARGLSAEEARREALRRFGGVDRFAEHTQDVWGGRLLDETLSDVRFSVRQMLRRPGFAALVLGTLALGVGATTALFGVARALLLQPLPFQHADRLVAFWSPGDWRGVEYDALRELDLEAMDGLTAFAVEGGALRTDGENVVLSIGLVTPEFLDVIGATPLMGRGFSEAEHGPGAEAVALLSHGLWRQEFGGDPSIVGRRIRIDDVEVTVTGVMPAGFFYPYPEIRMWRPLSLDPASPVYQGRGWLRVAGRLRPGAPDGAVSRDLDRMAALLGERFTYPPQWDKTREPWVEPLRAHLLGETRPTVLLLLAAVGLLLLTAASNVAALLLARLSDRVGEIGVRATLGAGRARLVRQVVTEGAVLGAVGGLLGAGLAVALHGALAASIPVSSGFDTLLTIDPRVVAAGVGGSILLGVVVALVPVRGVTGTAAASSLAEARGLGGGARGQRAQMGLVTVQVVMAVTLVTGATLLIRSVDRLMDVELGLEPENVTVADVYLGSGSSAERRQFFLELTARLDDAPGVAAAGSIWRLPLRETGGQGPVWIEDSPELRGPDAPNAYYRTVTPGSFEALGTRVLRGRSFNRADGQDAAPVAVVSESFAALAWPGEDPVGRRIAPVSFEEAIWTTVVGVVEDIRYEGPDQPAPRAIYRPLGQGWVGPSQVLVVRTEQDPAVAFARIRGDVAALGGGAAVHRTSTMDQVLLTAIARPLRLRFFLVLFGGLALTLGMVAIYGVVSYAVGRRTREYGLRKALGADPGRLVRTVVGRGMVPVGVGVAGGVLLSMAAGRALSGFLFGIAPWDLVSLGAASAVLLLAGVAAALAPAIRAGRVAPSEALRVE